MRLFVYGTLLDPELVTRLTGEPAMLRPATLAGFRRTYLRGTPYPTLAPAHGAVHGAVLVASRRGFRRLHVYEGPRYRLVRVRPRPAGRRASVTALAWIAPGATRIPWP